MTREVNESDRIQITIYLLSLSVYSVFLILEQENVKKLFQECFS